ncbi:MAG: hypothetical protein AB4050_12385 [Synechococcus sp.]
MLTFEQPTLEIDGTLLYADHAIPNQFYYVAPNPHLAIVNNRPMFDLYMYTVALEHSVLSGTKIPYELGAGFMNMGVECVIPPATLRTVRSRLADRVGILETDIVLAPVHYTDGTVSVIALDEMQNLEGEAGAAASDRRLDNRPKFVERILGAGKPSLLSNLRSIFSLKLSQEGAAFLEGLYSQGAAPVGVVYALEFYGLSPAVDVTIHANLSRIHKHFGGGLGGQYAWFKADINAGIDFLSEQSAIDIQITSQMTGEAAQKSKQLALELFKERIVQEMFKPSTPLNSLRQASTAAAALTGAASSGVAASSTGGGQISLTLKANLRYEDKFVTYSFNERLPQKRTHAPQAFLPLLVSQQMLRERIHRVPLDNQFFQTVEVLTTGPLKEEFTSMGIRQVAANFEYGDKQQTLLFRPDSTGDKIFGAQRNGRDSLAYTVQLVYEFLPNNGIDTDSFEYALPPETRVGQSLTINPNRDFGMLKVEVEPGRIHESVKQIDVRLSYDAPDAEFAASEQFRIELPSSLQQPLQWRVRTAEPIEPAYQVQVTYVFSDGTVWEDAPSKRSDPLVRIDAPFSQERSLFIRPNVIAESITEIDLEVQYTDEDRSYQREFLVKLLPSFASTELRWPIFDPNKQMIRYRETTFEPGFTHEGEWLETTDGSVVVGEKNSRAVTVTVRLIGGTLKDAGIDALLVTLEQLEADARHEIFFAPGEAMVQPVLFTIPPGSTLRYRWRSQTFKQDGSISLSDWLESEMTQLIISLRNL